MSADEEEFAPIRDDGSQPFRRAGNAERKVVAGLTSALKVARLHDLDNVVCREALEAFHEVLERYLGLVPSLSILLGRDRLYVNGAGLRMRRTGRSIFHEFIELMELLGIAALTLSGKWRYEAARALVECFRHTDATVPEERIVELRERLKALPKESKIELLDPAAAKAQSEDEEDTLTPAARATLCYARLVAFLERAQQAVRAEPRGDVDADARYVRQTLAKIVEGLPDAAFRQRLLAHPANPPESASALALHGANVTVLSLAMGHLLGLGRGPLANLGFAALFHDVGRAPQRFPDPPGAREDRELAEEHVVRGVQLLMTSKGVNDAALLRLAVAQEHHRSTDRYPDAGELRAPHPFSRIVGVADAFDKLEHGTPWHEAVAPVDALRRMSEEPERFESDLTGLLRDVLGTYPRGTALELKDRSVVIVVEGGARHGDRPIVRRVRSASGADEPGTLTSLDHPRREVKRELPPDEVSAAWRALVTR